MRHEDLVDGEWRIRSDDPREKNHAGKLKLPQVLIEILQGQPRIGDNPYVFPGKPRGRRTPGPAPLRSFAENKAQLDAKLPDMPPWVLHDLRRTARSLMSRTGALPLNALGLGAARACQLAYARRVILAAVGSEPRVHDLWHWIS